jgi:dihydroorotate dehydrogenase (fumarate)
MDLKTEYLGMKLNSPLVASASPVSESIDNIKKMEDAGASAVVLYSLFEEQLRAEQHEVHYHTTAATHSFAESLTYFPEPDEYRLGPEGYLEHIRKAKTATDIPIIASLNGSTPGGWAEYANKMQEAGADAIELNIYSIPTAMDMYGEEVEESYLDILHTVKSVVTIPVAVKLSPYFSNIANMARRLDDAGANGLVLFNRFYQPDIDIDELEVKPEVVLSHSSVGKLPMRWIGILKGRIVADLAATTGIHTGADAVKMLLAGANVTMMCSAILKNGIGHFKTVQGELVKWMEEKEYERVSDMIGAMSMLKTPNPGAYERAQYMKALTNYKF